MRILLVEDDKRLAHYASKYLGREGYEVSVEARGDTAPARILAEQPDLVILDTNLPGKNGRDVCREVRRQSYAGIILMWGSDSDIEQIVALELGADDYIGIPEEPRVLLARIQALTRLGRIGGESGAGATDELRFGRLHISQATRRVRLNEAEIPFSSAEFVLLWVLASHAGTILSRDDLLKELRGIGFDGLDHLIDARISRLRRKLGDDAENPVRIKTIRGKGYLFSPDDWD